MSNRPTFKKGSWFGIAWPNDKAKARGCKKVEITEVNEDEVLKSLKRIALADRPPLGSDIETILASKHLEYLMLNGKPLAGNQPAKHRGETHCFSCGIQLGKNAVTECIACGWKICPSCGACGCGYIGL